MDPHRWWTLASGVALVAAYVLTGRLGLELASYGQTVTLLWAPTGLALAALVLRGLRLWPAVWLGAFLTNLHLEPSLAASIAVGNTLEAVTGAWLVRWSGVDPALIRVRDVLLFLLWCAICPIVSATIGTATVALGGIEQTAPASSVWLAWWAGDATGAVTIAPVLMTWGCLGRSEALRERRVEVAALGAGTLLAALVGFGATGDVTIAGAVAAFPLIAWASLRFGTREATAVLAFLTIAAIVGTGFGRGWFTSELGPRPDAAWIYLCGVGATALLVTALVVERDAALEQLREHARELRMADRRKDEFLAMLGHELRNPLAAVAAGTRVLRRSPVDAEQHAWALQAIDRQVSQLTSLVNDLLDLTRISRGNIQLRREPVPLRELVLHVRRAVEVAMTAGHHTFECHLPEEDLVLDADPTRLEQVLVNLLTNAARYTPPGGRIDLVAEPVDGTARISIGDTGVGMDPEELAHAFEPFYQGRAGRGGGGLGLGLALIHQLVSLHGGQLSAESPGPGHGSTFRVTLPLAEPAALEARPKPAPSPTGRAAGLRILVVDDNVDAARGLRLLLEEQGSEVVTADDGRSGIAAAERFAPQLALVDIGLPDISGYEVARALKALPASRDAVLVAVTGFGTEGARRQADEAGFARFLIKPVDEERLLDMIAELAPELAQPAPSACASPPPAEP